MTNARPCGLAGCRSSGMWCFVDMTLKDLKVCFRYQRSIWAVPFCLSLGFMIAFVLFENWKMINRPHPFVALEGLPMAWSLQT